jgi:Rrf2 family protein
MRRAGSCPEKTPLTIEHLITSKLVVNIVIKESRMKLSTRTRYGVRLMVVLARNYGKGPVYLKDIANEEEISEKYLSQIIIPLRGIGLVTSSRGAYGGYVLSKPASEIRLREIVEVVEGDCLVDCVKNPSFCSRAETCATRDVWDLLGEKISETLDSITLDQLLEMDKEKHKKPFRKDKKK